MQKQNQLSDVVAGLVWIAFGVLLYSLTHKLSVMGSIFPIGVAIAFGVLGVLLSGKALLARTSSGQETTITSEEESELAKQTSVATQRPWRGVALTIVLLGWVLSIEKLGLPLSSILGFGVLVWIAGQGKLRLPQLLLTWLCGAVGIAAFILLMTQVLLLPVPMGEVFGY